MINFVSNLPQDLRTGGFSAMNAAAFAALRKLDSVHYAGPINPPVSFTKKALSKCLRVVGLQGEFFFFSQQRLQAIANEVRQASASEARLDFFHGFTPWVLTKPERPYVAWSDCTFRDYVSIFHRRDQFNERDLARIEQTEAAWLRNARRVLFTSGWAVERAISHYGLDAERVRSVGIFGEIDLPIRDAYAGSKAFAFASTNFSEKGGRIALSAIQIVRKYHPDASLVLVGDRPSGISVEPGVEFTGLLRKEIPDEYRRFQQILGRVRALVHPTKSDISPLLVIEAGYFGCPVIASRRFAIPELVDDGHTGLLLDDSSQVEAVAGAMNWMLEHEDAYRKMRQAAWSKTRRQHSKPQFEERLLASMREATADTFAS